VSGIGVGMGVDVGKVVGDGIIVGVRDAICVAVGVRAFPHPARNREINGMVVKARSI